MEHLYLLKINMYVCQNKLAQVNAHKYAQEIGIYAKYMHTFLNLEMFITQINVY